MKNIITFIIILFFLSSCEAMKFKKTDVKDNPINPEDKRAKNINEGKGLVLGGKKNSGVFDFATSNEMWRASLDVLDFVPLISADYGGGVIITDWYNDDNSSNESVKITIYFLSNEIRSDALNVKTHRKICENNNCKVSELKSEINEEIKLAILKKAALIKKEGLDKIIKEQGEYQVVPTEASK